MKEQIKDFLNLNRVERTGIIVLAIFMMVQMGWYYTKSCVRQSPSALLLDSVALELKKQQENIRTNPMYGSNQSHQYKHTDSLFDFDPNTLDSSGWSSLGFSAKQVHSILKYRKRAGHFETKKAVGKMFVVSDEMYRKIEPYITIPENYEHRAQVIPDINKASFEEWKSLPGIGNIFAARILKFRNRIGGFVRIEQLKEVYGITDSLFTELEDKLSMGHDANVHIIPVNHASFKILVKHPYLSFDEVKILVSEREKRSFIHWADLAERMGNHGIELNSLLQHYLSF